jgi:hypothetical protein
MSVPLLHSKTCLLAALHDGVPIALGGQSLDRPAEACFTNNPSSAKPASTKQRV